MWELRLQPQIPESIRVSADGDSKVQMEIDEFAKQLKGMDATADGISMLRRHPESRKANDSID
jgi:hypothetical protein